VIAFSSHKGTSKSMAKIGFWSSLLTGFLNLWYFIAFILYQPTLRAPWSGIDAYAASFQQSPFLAWVIPCFLLTLAFLTMIMTIYIAAGEESKTWGLFALVFAAIYTAILSTNYYIQMMVVRHNLIHKMTDGLSLWLYANYYPYSIPGALEGIGYLFMCLSFLCVSRVFSQGKLGRWVRWLFTAAGISGLLVFTDPLVKLPDVLVLIDLGIAGIVMTVGPLLLAVLFRRENSPV
jgi:hypothetical protein